MAVYEVFSHCVTFKYKSTLCSKSTGFLLIINALTIFLPLLVAYRSHGFWMKSASYQEQPKIHFKHEYVLYMETNRPDEPIFCTSLARLQEQTSQSREEDTNRDGKYDELFLEVQVDIPDQLSVYSIQLILVFDYILQKQCLLHMESLAYLQYSSGLAGKRLDVIADLKLVQTQLLQSRGRDMRFNKPVFSDEEAIDLHKAIRNYAKRNVSTSLQNVYPLWLRGELHEEPFQLAVNIHYPEDTIHYQPGFWQVMKWAWLQYLAVFVISHVLFKHIKGYIFMNRILPTVKETPWKKTF